MNQAFNITISVPSGNPDKLRLIEKTNRLSLGLVFHRDELAEVGREREELGYTGVYLLLNTSSDALPELYIGEGESVVNRLKSHHKDSKKDFWEWTVVFVNRDNSLHKGHIQHLEALLVERALENKRCVLKNEQTPNRPSLPGSVLIEADDLINDIYQIVPLLGISAFESMQEPATSAPSSHLIIKSKGVIAHAYQSAGKMVVKAGSSVVMSEVPSISSGFKALRHDLLEQGVIAEQSGQWVFTLDFAFASPSTAAAVVMGRNANGRIEWKTTDGITLKQIQETELAADE